MVLLSHRHSLSMCRSHTNMYVAVRTHSADTKHCAHTHIYDVQYLPTLHACSLFQKSSTAEYQSNWFLQQHTPTHGDRSRSHLLIFSSAWEKGKQHSWPMAPPSLSSCSPRPAVTPLFSQPLVLSLTDGGRAPLLLPSCPLCHLFSSPLKGQTNPVRMKATKQENPPKNPPSLSVQPEEDRERQQTLEKNERVIPCSCSTLH